MNMTFAVETWDPAYGVSATEIELEEASNPVDVGLEVPADQWSPRSPDPRTEPPSSVLFVDGVRRVDARVWIQDVDQRSHPGVCATVAAGAVRCRPTSALLAVAQVERALYTAAPAASRIETKHGDYELRPIVLSEGTDSNQAIYLAVHNHMTAIETSLEVSAEFGEMIVFDGPLRGRESAAAVGYVKTQQVQYLPDPQQRVVLNLNVGGRTPIFLIGGRFTRWSWYMRLPGPRSHGLSGIVRIELAGLGRVEDAAGRADQITATLPRYASAPHKDARAPQNLYPIAGLERDLRHRLGDPMLLERGLRVAAAAAVRVDQKPRPSQLDMI